MIDTIVLSIPVGYKIIDYSAFTPPAKDLFEPPFRKWEGRRTLKSIQNPKKKDITYRPKLTISKVKGRGSYPILRIESSLPKLIYGNNLQELSDYDFNTVLVVLAETLKEMGVLIELDVLKNAAVSAVHFSKNIVLEKGIFCFIILAELAKSDVKSHLDLSWTKYRNEGEALTFHSNSYEVCLYDKIRDIKKSKISIKRAIDSDAVLISGDSEYFSKEILRMEVRLNKTKVIRDVFSRVGCSRELTFIELFSSDLSRRILRYYWKVLKDNTPIRIHINNTAEQIFKATKEVKSLSLRLKLTAFILLTQELGVRLVKRMLSTRLFSSLNKTAGTLRDQSIQAYSPLTTVENVLKHFTALK